MPWIKTIDENEATGRIKDLYDELIEKRGEDILNINLILSYFNFVNRIALGLGVEHSPEEVSGYKV